MDQEPPEKPRPPLPPRSIPPVPPPAELVRGSVPHVPLTPMMDFLQRRLEALERELSLEREKARSAQGLIQQQESMRSEVEAQLKSLHENLRREKTERESEESKSHARGRIDALEKRLDDTHQAFVSLLKEAISQRESGTQAAGDAQAALAKEQSALALGQTALRQELSALAGAINGLMEQVSQWRTESQGLSRLAPEVKALANQIPADGRRLENQLAKQLADFSGEIRERISDWERRQELEAQKAGERIEALGREKAALLRSWEDQNHESRQQTLKDKISRENEVAGLIADMARRLDELALEQEKRARQAAELDARIAKYLETLTATPRAKDQLIEDLEREKSDFAKALRERSDSLRRHALERVEIEKTMGESLLRLQGELELAQKRELALSSRIADLELQLEAGKDKIASAQRVVADRDQRVAALIEERDQLARSVLGEADKNRIAFEERAKADEAWAQRISEVQKRLTEELALRTKESEVVNELRAQVTTLTDHMTRALQERDAIAHRFSSWEAERQKLLGSLKEKDEMISMLNATFQNMLKK